MPRIVSIVHKWPREVNGTARDCGLACLDYYGWWVGQVWGPMVGGATARSLCGVGGPAHNGAFQREERVKRVVISLASFGGEANLAHEAEEGEAGPGKETGGFRDGGRLKIGRDEAGFKAE